MSEAELHILKQRMLTGKYAKAERGELALPLPMGYVRRPNGDVIKDPNEQVQTTIALIFNQFERQGTLNGVLRYLVQHQVKLPVRVRAGPDKGTLQWRRPSRPTLSNVLHHPMYAGADVYGRRVIDLKRKKSGRAATGRTVVSPDQWRVLLKDRFPASITWAQFERHQQRLADNHSACLG